MPLAAFCLYGSNMRDFRRLKKKLPLAVILLLVLLPAGVFLLRSPVLIVTDSSFSQIYGPIRLKLKAAVISGRLFRRVAAVTVAESAGPDIAALIVEKTARAPKAVFFPYRYLEAARLYKENRPEVTVFITGGQKPRGVTNLAFVFTDTAADLFRAGLCASFLAGSKKVLIFTDGTLQTENREAFQEGIRTQAESDPIFINAQTDYSSYTDVGCVVLAGPAVKFLERKLTIPVILFSWVNPDLTPLTVKLTFDDSPWALAVKTLKSSIESGEIFIPSQATVISGRMEEKKDFRKLQGLIKETYQKK